MAAAATGSIAVSKNQGRIRITGSGQVTGPIVVLLFIVSHLHQQVQALLSVFAFLHTFHHIFGWG
jgi:hypothetical protein